MAPGFPQSFQRRGISARLPKSTKVGSHVPHGCPGYPGGHDARAWLQMSSDISDGLRVAQYVVSVGEQGSVGLHRNLCVLNRGVEEENVVPLVLGDELVRLVQHSGALFEADDSSLCSYALFQHRKA